VYAAKAMETLMSEHADLGVSTPDSKFGMTKEAAALASSRVKAMSATLVAVAKHIDARAGKGESIGLGDDLDAALSQVGMGAMDAACGHYAAVDLSKAEDEEGERKEKALSEDNVTAVVQHIGAGVETLLDVRRKVQEGDEDTTAMMEQLDAAMAAIAGIKEILGGEAGEEETEEEKEAAKVAAAKAIADGEEEEDKPKVDAEKAGEIISGLVKERIAILVTAAQELEAGVGTMTDEEAKVAFSKLNNAVWSVRDDFLLLAKSMGQDVADKVDTARVTALEKSMGLYSTKLEKALKTLIEHGNEIDSTQEAANSLLEMFNAATGITDPA